MGLRTYLRRAFQGNTTEARALAYLNEATSHADLERRHREIDRGRFSSRSSQF